MWVFYKQCNNYGANNNILWTTKGQSSFKEGDALYMVRTVKGDLYYELLPEKQIIDFEHVLLSIRPSKCSNQWKSFGIIKNKRHISLGC